MSFQLLFACYISFLSLFIMEETNNKNSFLNKQGSDYQLVWNDEFDIDGAPDSSRWNFDIGNKRGWGNNELQYYTNRRENVRVEEGKLIIEARKEDFESFKYTSCRIKTKDKGDWKYGRIEVMAKIPKGKGTWPAIWMLPTLDEPMSWPEDGEIDIMEHVGFDPGRVHGTIHTEAYNHRKGTQKAGIIDVNDFAESFHLYAIEWDAKSIRWFIDKKEYFIFKNEGTGNDVWPYDNPFHLILNIAVGGDWGGKMGIDDSIWPQKMEVDWVRIYQKK